MKEIWKKGCSFLVSATLAVGLIPVPAFAQAAEAVTSSGGITAAVPQENLKEVQQPLAQAEPSGKLAVPLVAQDVDAVMALDQSYDVSLSADEFWVGSFTAAQAGTYQFASSGDYDTIGYLYSDSDLTTEIAEDDQSGSGNNFLIIKNLEAGQTVFLKAEEYYGNAADFSVSVSVFDTSDLANADFYFYPSMFKYTGQPISVTPTVADADGYDLTEGSDYQLVYWGEDGQELSAPPSETGKYKVSARAKTGGSYKGETEKRNLTIYDPYDIGEMNGSWDGDNTFGYTGNPITLPAYTIDYYDDTVQEDVFLEEGQDKDFKLSHYYKTTDPQKKLTASDLVDPGEYYAVYEGVGKYNGTREAEFYITGGETDMKFATISLNRTMYTYTGQAVSFDTYDIDVWDIEGYYISSSNYTLVYYNAAGTKLASAPSEPGDYTVGVAAASGSEYTGESIERAKFTILDPNDLRGGDYYAWFNNEKVAANKSGITLPPVIINRESDETRLVEGTDYTFDHIETEEGVTLSGMPTDIGSYYVFYKGIGAYKGSTSAWLEVCDPNDLSSATFKVTNYDVPLVKGVAVPEVTVTDLAGNKLTQDRDYSLVYATYDDDYEIDWSTATPTPPSKTGEYFVRATAVDGGAYYGHTSSTSFEVYDPFDIGAGYWNSRFWPNRNATLTGSSITLPTPIIYNWEYADGEDTRIRLHEGTDFVFDHFESSEREDIGKAAPTKPDNYYAVYAGKGDYHGFNSISFSLYDTNDIGSDYWEYAFQQGDTYYTDGAPIVLRPLVVYNGDDAKFLAEGSQFKFSHFKDWYGNELASAPSANGTYYAVYTGVSPYTGTLSARFTVRNSFSLNNAAVSLADDVYPATGSPVQLAAKVRDCDGVLLESGKDYQFVYYKYAEDDGTYTKLDGAPSAEGAYYVAAQNVSGGIYTGESPKERFVIGKEGPQPISPVDPVKATLTIDTPATVQVQANQYWIGTFTAPAAGAYVFWSEGGDDTVAYLYEDASLENEINYNDDSGNGNNFRMAQSLESGQTVYLKVREYGNEKMSCTVTANRVNEKDLANASFDLEENGLVLQGASVAPVVILKDAAGNSVPQSAYVLKYSFRGEDGWEAIDGEPSKVGYYEVKAVAKDGSGFVGSTRDVGFNVYSPSDLAKATITLESSEFTYTGSAVKVPVAVTDASGKALVEGKDYDLDFFGYNYDEYDRLSSAPAEVGEYYVIARAKAGSGYTGHTRNAHFVIVNPTDLSSGYSIALLDEVYSTEIGYDNVPTYLNEGSAVMPDVRVRRYNGGTVLSAGTDYTVTYNNNTAPTSGNQLASATITGKGTYSGSVTLDFAIVSAIDLDDYLWYSGCMLTKGNTITYYSHYADRPQFVADGWPVMPTVAFTDGSSSYIPKKGADFTVSYVDANDKPVAEPTKPGKYAAVLTATATGKCSGTAKVPFAIVDPYELDYQGVLPTLANANAFSYDRSYRDYDTNTITYNTNEVAGTVNVGDFLWSIFAAGKQLTEGVDYLLTTAVNSAGDLLTFVFTGTGSYTGTVTGQVKLVDTPAKSFDSRSVWFENTVRNVVYRNPSGALEIPNVMVDGLTAGTDYTFTSLTDASGKAVTTANTGDTVYATITGAGAFANCKRTIEATVVDGTSVVSLDSNTVQFTLENGVSVNKDGNQWYLTKNTTPTVALVVYKRPVLVLNEGNGFSVSNTVSGNTMNVKLAATANSPVSGSATKTVNLVDKYNLNDLFSMVRVADPTSAGKISGFAAGSATGSAVELEYGGISYMPTVTFPALRAGEAQFTATLTNASGAQVSNIAGLGNYTLTIAGEGDWSGALKVPIQVTALVGGIDLASCDMAIGENKGLVGGPAKPTVTLTCGDYTLVEGTDYTVEYGNNTKAGERAWVKANAVKGGKFTGASDANFTVAGAESKVISKANYELWLQDPATGEFVSSSAVYTYPLGTKPAAQLKYRDKDGVQTVVDSKFYSLSYSDVGKAGLAHVTATGANGYTGSLSADFYLASSVAKKEQTITASNKSIQVADKVNLGAKTNGDGKLSYVSSDITKATVDQSGNVTGLKAGTVTITITASETAAYQAATKTVTVTVTAKPAPQPQKKAQAITASNKSVKVGKTVKLGATTNGDGALTYKSSDTSVATVSTSGVVTGKKAGKATITVTASATASYLAATKTITVTVSKSANTLVVKSSSKTLKYSTVKKKNSTFASNVIKTKGKGTTTYKIKSVTKKYKKYVTVNAKSGKVTVKKKAPKGTCTLKITVKAAGTTAYSSASKVAKVTIKIK